MPKHSMTTSLNSLIEHYNARKLRRDNLIAECNDIRDQIAKRLQSNGHFKGAILVKVTATWVKEHRRNGYTTVRT